MPSLNNQLYTASAVAIGARTGHARTSDGLLEVDLAAPKEMGGPGGATNPEQLFAAGYAACFQSALGTVARREGVDTADSKVTVDVTIGTIGNGAFGLAAVITVYIPGVAKAVALRLADAAHLVCPYSFDLPGLGGSSVPADGGYDDVRVAARIHQGVVGLGYWRVSILAHDLGSQVAYAYARDFGAGVTRMAVLEAELNGFGAESAYGLSWHLLFNQAPYPVPEEIINDKAHVRTYLGWLLGSARHPAAIAQRADIDAYADAAHRSAGFDYYRAFPANAAANKISAAVKVRVPVLAMGAKDVFGPAVAQSFRQVASDVRQVLAPDSGHWIPEENPAFLEQCANLFFGPGGTAPTGPALTGCTP